MPKQYEVLTNVRCAICNESFNSGKKFTNHLRKVHNVRSVNYTIEHLLNGIVPKCLVEGCSTVPRYVALTFKRYCKEHSYKAESTGGHVGGVLKETWNKDQTKETDERIASLAIKLCGEGNPFFGKKHDAETVQRIADKHRLSLIDVENRVRIAGGRLVTKPGEYSRRDESVRLACVLCGIEDEEKLVNIERCWRCKNCFPLGSRQQIEILNFVKSLEVGEVMSSIRSVIPPLELDVWVPSQMLAIEYHGLYWHSGGKSGVFDKNRHRQKYLNCKEVGIRLIQFFSDEWIGKREICESMIRNVLKKNTEKIHARSCRVREVDAKISRTFADENHISGKTRATKHFGLFDSTNRLVGLATVRTPIQKKWGHVTELARMCFLKGTTVVGGASKLMKRVEEDSFVRGFEGVLSYAELRYGDGGVYEKCGFTCVGEALNNYWFTDGNNRFDRFKFRAQPGKSEKVVYEEAGVRPVFGCGNRIYVKKFKKAAEMST